MYAYMCTCIHLYMHSCIHVYCALHPRSLMLGEKKSALELAITAAEQRMIEEG